VANNQEFLRRRGVPAPVRGTYAAAVSRLLGAAGVATKYVEDLGDSVGVSTRHSSQVEVVLRSNGYVFSKGEQSRHTGMTLFTVTGKYPKK
jgi:hypothetical protein